MSPNAVRYPRPSLYPSQSLRDAWEWQTECDETPDYLLGQVYTPVRAIDLAENP